MPTYTYRREDGTTFDVRQKFTDEPLTVDPSTGQQVVRVVQAAGVIFKGSGFYVTDNRGAKSTNGSSKSNGSADAGSSSETKASESSSSEAKASESSSSEAKASNTTTSSSSSATAPVTP